jgi:diacylglycerol kinase (ATP)
LHRGPALNLTLANGAHFGAGLRISPASRPDDGVLDLVLVAPLPRLRALRVLARLRHGGHLALPEVRVQPVRDAVRLDAGAASCGIEMDGEAYRAAGALTVELLPGRLAVRC